MTKKLVNNILQIKQVDYMIEKWDDSKENLEKLIIDTLQNMIFYKKITKFAQKYF